MATSGSFSTNAYSDSDVTRYLVFSWSIQSQSIADNATTIEWSLKGAGSPENYWVRSGGFKVVIDGDTVYEQSTDYRIDLYGGTVVASGTKVIYHNNDGTASFSASAEAGIYSYAVNCTGSGSWELASIPRYATVSQTLASKTETTISVKWSADSVVDYIWYSSNDGSSWSGINVADGKGGTYTISGLTAGTHYNIKTRVRRKDSQLTTDSSAMDVQTYTYPYAISCPSFTIGDSTTITLYNPLKHSVTLEVSATNGDVIATFTTTGTYVTGLNSSNAINRMYASIPNAKRGTCICKVTYGSHENEMIGGSYKIKESECKPSISSVSYEDVNQSVVAITENNKRIVRNQSTVLYTASGLAAQHSASIVSCSVSVNGTDYSMTISGTTAIGGNASIDSGTNVTARVTVTDSRGLTASKSVTVTMLDWYLPSAIITLQRESNYYSETTINVDADIAYVDGKNAVTITYKAKRHGTSTYTISGTLQDNVSDTFTANNQYKWDVQVTLVDSFGGTTTYNQTLTRGMPIIFFDRDKSSVGINTFPQSDGTLEIDGLTGDVAANINALKALSSHTETNDSYGVSIKAYRRSGTVMLYIFSSGLAMDMATSGAYITVATLPEEYRPVTSIISYPIYNGTTKGQLVINANGEVRFGYTRKLTETSNSNLTQGSLVYIVAMYLGA